MNKVKGHDSIKIFIQIIFTGFGILLFVIAVNWLAPSPVGSSQNVGYPPPGSTSYPPPGMNVTVTVSISSPRATIPPPQMRDAKDGHILSTTEIAAIATFDAEKNQAARAILPLNRPSPTISVFPVASPADLPQVVYNDPFYGSTETGMGLCVQAKKPGPAVYVHSLDVDPDYYIVPFFKDNVLCGKALVEIKNGLGYAEAIGEAYGDKYPQLSADEAISQVILKTGKKVVVNPVFVFGGFKEAGNPLNPFWKVITADGQIYYVIFVTARFEDSLKIETRITVLSASEIHPIN